MIIQYISDIHLEHYNITKIKRILASIIPMADICVLAGDIGNPFQKIYEYFIIAMNEKFKHVILIHGNHEYYQSNNNIRKHKEKTICDTVEKTINIIESNNLLNIHFLNNSYIDIPNENGKDYRFVGSVLWSKILDPEFLINDRNLIYNYSVPMVNNMFDENCKYISSVLDESEDKNVIVVTHFLPSYKLINPIYLTGYMNDLNQNFASDCDFLIRKPVVCWIYGHTHLPIDLEINGITLLSNPIGYPGENKIISFNKVIDIL